MRAASVFDAAALAAVHAAAFPAGERWGVDAMALQLGLPGAFGFLTDKGPGGGGGMVLARVAADEAEVLTLGVAPGAQRAGLGRLLLAASMAEAARRGAASMVLEVAEPNVAGRALYAGAGFRLVGRRRGYYAGGVDALVLRSALAE